MEASQEEGKTEENGIYIVIENTVKTPKEKYKRKAIKILSILHLVSGSLAISVAVIMLILKSGYQRNERRPPFSTVGEGLFCGIMFLVTGIIGITSIKRTTYCKISAFLVLSILSSLSGFMMILLSLTTMGWSLYKNYTPGIVCHCLLIICGLFELVLGTVSSSFSCHACCGCCGGEQGPGGGGNSVVYVPSQVEQGDTAKPRVVHLNMIQLQEQLDKQAVTSVTGKKEENEEKEEKEEKTCKGYSRFS